MTSSRRRGSGGRRPTPEPSGAGRPKQGAGPWLLIGLVLLLLLAVQHLQRGKTLELGASEMEDYLTREDRAGLPEHVRALPPPGECEVIYNQERVAVVHRGKEVAAVEVFAELGPEWDRKLLALYREHRIRGYRYASPNLLLQYLLSNILPFILLFGFLYFLFFRSLRSAGGTGGVLSFGKSRAKLKSKDRPGVTFEDVAGIDEAKEEVTEIIQFLKSPERFQRLGGRIPRGVLLVGPPGTGKTLLAKAIAGEAGVPFFSISGSDFVEMFVGVGASRVRDLFKQAKEKSPCIIFLDEIDAVGRRRGGPGFGGGHDEREQTLNAILVEMDGFETDSGVIVVAATNRPDVLDPALLRPGRFDRQIVISLPDLEARRKILGVHARRVKMDASVDLDRVSRGTVGFSGAELEAVINEAALGAVMHERPAIVLEDLEEARDKVRWGRKKTSRMRTMDDQVKRTTAYHETGHALVSKMTPGTEPVHKVSIIPMGTALGMTMFLPQKDRYQLTRGEALGHITVAFGGHVAEEIFCKDVSSGASNDLKQATEIARLMVTEWGMSERIGLVNHSDSEEHPFLGRELTGRRCSEATSQVIDEEVKRILESCHRRARDILDAHRDDVERIAAALLARESLDGEEIDRLLRGEALPPLANGREPAVPLRPSPGGTPAEKPAGP